MKHESKILLSAYSFFILAGGLIAPLYAVYVENIGGDLLTAGSAYAVFSLVLGISTLLIAKLEDRVNKPEVLIVLGYLTMCFGYAGYLLVSKPWHLFIVEIMFGLGAAIAAPPWDMIYAKEMSRTKGSSHWGLIEAMNGIGAGIAAFLGGIIANYYGFRSLLWIMLQLSLVGLILSTYLLRKHKRNR